jgi:hypothetical protein
MKVDLSHVVDEIGLHLSRLLVVLVWHEIDHSIRDV